MLLVSFVTAAMQICLIEVGGEFVKTSPLTWEQWLITVALGAIGLPVGVLMRFIPVEEDPESFFYHYKPQADGDIKHSKASGSGSNGQDIEDQGVRLLSAVDGEKSIVYAS